MIKKVVLIGQSIQAVISLSNFLEFHEFRTSEAYNLKDGIQLIISEDPSYIFIDALLNGETTKEVVKQFPKKTFILLFRDESEQYRAKNIRGMIQKPVDNEEVLNLLNK